MGQVIEFNARRSGKVPAMSAEEKREWGAKFQSLLKTMNDLKRSEQELEWKIKVKCQAEFKSLETLRMKLATINKEIQSLTQKLNPQPKGPNPVKK